MADAPNHLTIKRHFTAGFPPVEVVEPMENAINVAAAIADLQARVGALENPPPSPLYQRGNDPQNDPLTAGNKVPFGESAAAKRGLARADATDIQRLKWAVEHISAATRLLAKNSILGSSMKEERQHLCAIGKSLDAVVVRYESPPPLPPGASVVAKRDDYPANDGVSQNNTPREPVIEVAKERGCFAVFMESVDGVNLYEFRRNKDRSLVDIVAVRGEEWGFGATRGAALADLPPENDGASKPPVADGEWTTLYDAPADPMPIREVPRLEVLLSLPVTMFDEVRVYTSLDGKEEEDYFPLVRHDIQKALTESGRLERAPIFRDCSVLVVVECEAAAPAVLKFSTNKAGSGKIFLTKITAIRGEERE